MLMNRTIPFISMAILILLCGQRAQAQTDQYSLEWGFHYSALNLSDFGVTDSGVGTRFTYNIHKHIALEAEGNFFPTVRFNNSGTGQKAQGLIGVRAGTRIGKIGLFGKLRPGAMFLGAVSTTIENCFPSFPGVTCKRRGGSRFTLDAGGVAEIYPSEEIVLRVDFGDTMIKFNQDRIFLLSDQSRTLNGISHNFQFTLGIAFRF